MMMKSGAEKIVAVQVLRRNRDAISTTVGHQKILA